MRRSFAGALVLLLASTATAQQPAPTRLILLVGDGVGLAQWSAARMAGGPPLSINRLSTIGLMDTRGTSNRTTDSAAGATAFATGTRTRNGFVAVGPDSARLTTVLEVAEQRGLATGLVTTSYILDATPAAFAAHSLSRYDRETISAQFAEQDIEVLMGGGRHFFEHRRDGRNLLEGLSRRYTTVTTPAQFAALDLARTERLLGLFADSLIFPNTHLRPALPEMARAALAILDRNPRGFFLLLETEDTDELGHANDSLPKLVTALRELDATIGVALEYQARHPETLIVVLGDHETGALSLQIRRDGGIAGNFGSRDHSAAATLIFAGGPGAERFGAWLDNAEVGRLLLEHVGAGAESE